MGAESRSRILSLLGSPYTRLVVTATLLAYVASRIDWGRLGDRIAGASVWSLPVAVVLIVVALCVGAVRWHWLLEAASIPLAPRDLARVYAIATFSSTFLPTSVGGDVARALLVTREPGTLVRVALTIVLDRAAAVMGLLIVAWFGVALEPNVAPEGAVTALAVVTVAIAVGGAFVLWLAGRGTTGLQRLTPQRLYPLARGLRESVNIYRRRPWTVLAAVGASVVFQLLVTAQLLSLAAGFGIDLAFGAAAVTLTLVLLATLIPVSIAGFGIREGSYIVVLGGVGINATDATILSLATVAALLIASLPGAFLLIRSGTKATLS